MKKISKILAALLAAAVAVAGFAFSAGATEAPVTVSAPVSSADGNDLLIASASDVSNSDVLAGRGTVTVNLDKFGVTFKIPELENIITANDISSVSMNTLGLAPSSLLDNNFLTYALDMDQSNMALLVYNVSEFTKSIGDYNKLSQDDLNNIYLANLATDANVCEIREINGQKWIYTRFDSVNGSDVQTELSLVTIANGVEYNFNVMSRNHGSEADNAVLDEIANSISVRQPGLGFAFAGSSVNKWLIAALCIVGFIALMLLFLVIRFSAYQKAAGSPFNIFGMDFPRVDEEDDGDDDDDEDEDDED